MPTVWFALKRSLQCKSEPSEVYDPRRKSSFLSSGKMGRSGCSRSIANLKDVVIHGSKRHLERPPSCSPRSIGSSEFINPISHQVFLNSSTCELKISGFHGGSSDLRPKSPAIPAAPPPRPAKKPNFSVGSSDSSHRCHKCGEKFGKWEVLETHHLSRHAGPSSSPLSLSCHAPILSRHISRCTHILSLPSPFIPSLSSIRVSATVTELGENDSSRKIVEIICRSNWLKGESSFAGIERVLKVHNLQKTLARFEEHREAVKQRAGKLPKKHPRCLADGNELLRFHGTTVSCSLGDNGASSLCFSENCRVCRIIRQGFSPAPGKTTGAGEIGVFTTSTSGRALESVAGEVAGKKALLLCRVIAGRVHRPVEDLRELPELAGFDSLAGKLGLHANIEELYLLNPRALLPCFVVICKS